MSLFSIVFTIISVPFIIFVFSLVFILFKLATPPDGNPNQYLKKMMHEGNIKKETIMLIGDSITQGNASANYVDIIAKKLQNANLNYDIINGGINGNTAMDLLKRIKTIMQCNPNFSIVLIGTNDSKNSLNSVIKVKDHLKRDEILARNLFAFKKNLISVVESLKSIVENQIAIISIPPIGEVPSDPAFKISRKFASIIEDVAKETGVFYIPLNEKMVAYLEKNPGNPRYSYKKWFLIMFLAILKNRYLKRSYREIGEKFGFNLHSDYLHMNEIGAEMIASEIFSYIKKKKGID